MGMNLPSIKSNVSRASSAGIALPGSVGISVHCTPFPSMYRCLDMSRDSTCIALVDSSGTMCVFDCASGELQRCVDDVESLAWHGQIDGLLCWSGAGVLRWCLGSFMAQHIIMTV